MSSEKAPAPSPQQQQPQQKPRKPPLSDWPTIKIVTPPQGRFSPKKDEWCFTVCSQSIVGRVHAKEPACHSICLRRVFAHEVKNVLSYNRHANIGPDGKAKYPLPAEGQPNNLPRILGGVASEEDDVEAAKKPVGPTSYWDEGWYLWTGNTRKAMHEKTVTMRLSLQNQQKLYSYAKGESKDLWHEHQAKIQSTVTPEGHLSLVKLNLSSPEDAMLVALPPDVTSVLSGIRKLLAPSIQVLGILRKSLASGEQQEFVKRVWAKAKTDEPFILAQRTLSSAYDTWKKRDTVEDDGKKGST